MGEGSLDRLRLQWLRVLGVTAQRALALIGLIVLVVTVTPLDVWWAGKLAGKWEDPAGDVLIVLGGSGLDDGQVGGSSYWRCIYGAMAYRQGGFKQVLVTGGGVDAVPIAVSMKNFLTYLGVPGDAILVEPHSTSTRENALFSKPILAGLPGKKVLLTSDYHMFRAARVFEKAGIQVFPRPYPDVSKRAGAWTGRWPAFIDLAGEDVKIVYYRVHGWV